MKPAASMILKNGSEEWGFGQGRFPRTAGSVRGATIRYPVMGDQKGLNVILVVSPGEI
jgi:hypothetical protein